MGRLLKAAVGVVAILTVLYASGVAPAAYNLWMNGGTALTRRSTVNFTGAGVICADDVVNGRTNCTVTGGGGGTGIVTYRKDFAGAASLTITNAEHGFNSPNLSVACYDDSAPPAYFEPASVTIDAITFEIVVTFVGLPTGYCVVQGGGHETRSFGGSFDGGGSALTPGKTVYTTVPFACTVQAWNIVLDAGTATVDVWRVATGTAIPVAGDSITGVGAGRPVIVANTAIHSTNLTGWTSTAMAKNDIIGVNLEAVATATYVNLVVECQK